MIDIIFIVSGGDIPGGATLIYDVEVIQMRGARGGGGSNDITKLKKRFRNIDTDNDKQITYDEVRQPVICCQIRISAGSSSIFVFIEDFILISML